MLVGPGALVRVWLGSLQTPVELVAARGCPVHHTRIAHVELWVAGHQVGFVVRY